MKEAHYLNALMGLRAIISWLNQEVARLHDTVANLTVGDVDPISDLPEHLQREWDQASDILDGLEPGECRGCGATVRWCRTARSNSPMPLDPVPRDDGNIVMLDGRAHYVSATAVVAGRRKFVSHYATCPKADTFRKGGK